MTESNPLAPAAPRWYFGYWLIVLAFVAQFFSTGMQNYVIGAFMTPMTDDLGWTRTEFTSPRTIGQFVLSIIGFLIGSQVDRIGARPFMLAGVTVLVVALFLLSHTQTLTHWLVLNGLVLTTGAALIGNLVVNVTLAKWFVELRGRAIAFSSMGVSFAGIVLTPLSTWCIDQYGWRASWQLLAVATAIVMYPIALQMRRTPEDHGWHPDGKSNAQVAAGLAQRAEADYAASMTRAEALRTQAFYALIIAFGLFAISIPVMLIQTIPLMTDAGYSRSVAALMITLASIPAMLSKPVWGYLIDKYNGQPLAAIGAATTGFSLLIIIFGINHQADLWVYFGFFLLGMGWGGMIPIQEVIWAGFFGRRYLGAVRSAALPFSLLLGATAPLLVAYYHDRVGNYDGAIAFVGILSLIAAVLMLLVQKPTR